MSLARHCNAVKVTSTHRVARATPEFNHCSRYAKIIAAFAHGLQYMARACYQL